MKYRSILSSETDVSLSLDFFKNRSEYQVRNERTVVIMLEMTHPRCHLLLGVWEQAESIWVDEICSSPILCDAAEVSEFFSGVVPLGCQTPRGCLQKTHPLGSLWVYISPAPYLFRTAENKPGLSLPAVGFNAAAKVLLVTPSRWD